MADLWKRVHGPAQVSNAAATKYTVGANRRGTIRNIHVQNPSGSTVNFTLSIGLDAPTPANRLYDAYPIPAGAVFDFPFPHVLEAAEVIQAFASTNNVLVLEITATEALVS